MNTRHECGADHQGDRMVEARCDWLGVLEAELTAYAATLDQPPTRAQVRDLWAHARRIHDDGYQAAHWTRKVLDLGWRPAVGAS